MQKVIKHAAMDALKVGLLGLLLFGPMTGMLLDGYGIHYAPSRAFWLVGLLLLGRFMVVVVMNSPALSGVADLFKRKDRVEVVVSPMGQQHHKILVVLTLMVAMALPFLLSKYWLNVAILALIYILLGLGLNIVVGLAGLLDLGFVAFYAVGAYSYALGAEYLGLSFWQAIPFAALLAASFGAVLGFPVLRMHGDYLAIVTLGFGEIIRLVLNNWISLTGGPNGLRTPLPTLFGMEFTKRATQGGTPYHEVLGQWMEIDYSRAARYVFIYVTLLVVVTLLVYMVQRLKRMPIGRAWEALREDEIACRSLGINHVMVKLSAFSMGAMVGGVGGVFFAASQGFVNPASFTFFESALILAIVVLGGLGSVVGVIVAAVVLTVLPELLRDFTEYRVLIFGCAMVVMMVWRPRGLLRIHRPEFVVEKRVP
ncbi:amino acid/amide ABC transporter membrane protein 2, HAAT family [Magnetococcus marinus MC-1]|uniref:Amino acid/amide ABC transporter membrane protein 2, HAAT family n=1 Tax=Magnetococcus marinus (strain ATCC BAA-1437 / JCM 17883 / MC-1) TaxID=156889 RepID=A0L4X0_MAGMM|nr:high-affinity branched-chain amino acid ABC transporter permease LivM [Magnetococcus marinus]ABK43013.1 amino acid/amide ABC transporter membrane protein 2, HAAT family [Magnetococcus marinus MC-1]